MATPPADESAYSRARLVGRREFHAKARRREERQKNWASLIANLCVLCASCLFFFGVSDAMLISWPCFAHSTSLRTSRWPRHQPKNPLTHMRGSWGFHNLETGTGHPCKVIAKNIRGAGTAAKGQVDVYLRAMAPSREMSSSCSATPCPSSSLCFIPIFLCDGHTTHLANSWEKWRTRRPPHQREEYGTQDATIGLILLQVTPDGTKTHAETFTLNIQGTALQLASVGPSLSHSNSVSFHSPVASRCQWNSQVVVTLSRPYVGAKAVVTRSKTRA